MQAVWMVSEEVNFFPENFGKILGNFSVGLRRFILMRGWCQRRCSILRMSARICALRGRVVGRGPVLYLLVGNLRYSCCVTRHEIMLSSLSV